MYFHFCYKNVKYPTLKMFYNIERARFSEFFLFTESRLVYMAYKIKRLLFLIVVAIYFRVHRSEAINSIGVDI